MDIDVYIRVPEHPGEDPTYKAVIYCYPEPPLVLRSDQLDTLMADIRREILALMEKVVAKRPR